MKGNPNGQYPKLDDQNCETNKLNELIGTLVLNEVVGTVPSNPEVVSLDSDLKSGDNVIYFENTKTLCMRDHAIAAAVTQYTNNEKKRIERQAPLLKAVIGITGAQVLFFNVIIIILVFYSFNKLTDFSLLFDILKYYIGATIVELIGLVVFITKGTFSNDHIKIMKHILGKSMLEDNASESQSNKSD